MRKVKYGTTTIEYAVEEKNHLASHYISVDREAGVVLKGRRMPVEKADRVVLKKARWIVDKLNVVGASKVQSITTGSRLPYLGKNYYVQVIKAPGVKQVEVTFNYSTFSIKINGTQHSQQDIHEALQTFYAQKAEQKITPRVKRLSIQKKLPYNRLSYRKMSRRWGSCTPGNSIIINTEAIKLSFSLIDYLIIHELCHTRVKDHSKAYWAELSKHEPKWKSLEEKIANLKI